MLKSTPIERHYSNFEFYRGIQPYQQFQNNFFPSMELLSKVCILIMMFKLT
jgi:hypothetical protein